MTVLLTVFVATIAKKMDTTPGIAMLTVILEDILDISEKIAEEYLARTITKTRIIPNVMTITTIITRIITSKTCLVITKDHLLKRLKMPYIVLPK
jgi:hypothetical protein